MQKHPVVRCHSAARKLQRNSCHAWAARVFCSFVINVRRLRMSWTGSDAVPSYEGSSSAHPGGRLHACRSGVLIRGACDTQPLFQLMMSGRRW